MSLSINPINRRSRPARARYSVFACALALLLSPLFCAAQTSPPDLEQTRAVIAQMRAPMRSVPLDVVIEALYGHKVLPFNHGNRNHAEVLKRLDVAAVSVIAKIKAEGGISSKRVNEVGNTIEQYVRDALTAQGMPARVPTTKKSGRARAVGYPDVTFTFKGEHFYLDCKTYNKETANTTMRTFYLSPSDDPKISRDAVHLILSFETARKGDVYQLASYKIVSLEKLSLDLKYEFNSDNRRMYSGKDGAEILAGAVCK